MRSSAGRNRPPRRSGTGAGPRRSRRSIPATVPAKRGSFGGQEADLRHQQQPRLDVRAAEAVHEAVAPRVPGAALDRRADLVGAVLPERARAPAATMRRNAREPVAGSPAHERGGRVHALARAQLPHARVRRRIDAIGLLADALETREVLHRRGTQQAAVEEGLRRGQHDVAIDVVLQVLERLVADAHRAHAAIAGERRDLVLLEARARARCRTPAAGARPARGRRCSRDSAGNAPSCRLRTASSARARRRTRRAASSSDSPSSVRCRAPPECWWSSRRRWRPSPRKCRASA